MADATATPETPAAEQEQPGKTSMMTFAKIGAVVVVILSAEALIAFLFIPSADSVAATAESRYNPADVPADPVAALDADASDEPMLEVDLKAYTVTAAQPLSNTTLRIDFHLYGIVAAKDQMEFDRLFAKREQRVREQVEVTIRGSEITDLTDAGLGLVKRKIHDKVNRILGKALVKSLIVSEFSFVEQ